jgi:hypothetical protein
MMDEQKWILEWGASNPESDWIQFLSENGATPRKFRLFCCACCRLVWDLLTLAHTREAVEVAERFADGLATEAERNAAEVALYPLETIPDEAEQSNPAYKAAPAAMNAVWRDPRGNHDPAHGASYIEGSVLRVLSGKGSGSRSSVEERGYFAWKRQILPLWGDIFGVLFRESPSIDPLRRIPAVLALAQAAYDNRQLPDGTLEPDRLAVLADALEEAGCTDADILGHLRGPGPHVRGCWPVDLLLVKG